MHGAASMRNEDDAKRSSNSERNTGCSSQALTSKVCTVIGELSRRGAIVAALLVLVVILSASHGGVRSVIYATAAVLFPLACIIYPSAMGSVRGLSYITKTSNPIGMSLLG